VADHCVRSHHTEVIGHARSCDGKIRFGLMLPRIAKVDVVETDERVLGAMRDIEAGGADNSRPVSVLFLEHHSK